ncbi:hypothetical protein ACIRQQ_34700 [Streptomyces fuscichromogenes]|uniref:hypothetical protein n=1 Tax=Streptomyces fuscichromogenes TaxID=1324013 RepID=UPI0038192147
MSDPAQSPHGDAAPLVPATPLLSTQEMFLELMAAPWMNREPARVPPASRS